MHPTQHALESALVANPDDLAAHSAYADFLSEQGDPRGEFIQVQLQLEQDVDSEQRNVLKGRALALFDEHGREWLGELYEILATTERRGNRAERRFEYERGWLELASLPILNNYIAQRLINSRDLLKLLRRLFISNVRLDAETLEFVTTKLVNEMPVLAALKEFHFGHSDYFEDEASNLLGKALDHVLKKMPNLEHLRLESSLVDLGRFFERAMPARLSHLEIRSRTVYPLEALARNPALSRLTHLILEPPPFQIVGENDTSYLPFEQIRALLESKHLGKLTHLTLRCSDLGDEGCKLLVKSGLLKTLKALDLERGTITDAGVAILAECPDAKTLERLNLSWNRIEEGFGTLTSAGIKVEFSPYSYTEYDDPQQHLFDDIME